jgi:hypothetical protein
MRRAVWSKSFVLTILASGVAALGTGCPGSVGGLPTGGQNGGEGGGATTSNGGHGDGGSSGTAGSSGGLGGSTITGAGGATGVAGASGVGGSLGPGGTTGCATALADRVRVTEIDVGVTYAYNEVDNNGAALGLTPLAISPIPGGGSRLAFLGKTDSMAHVVTLDASDQPVPGSAFALPAFDFQDIYADASGGVMLLSRNALGSTDNHNCGNINNLCGLVANYPTAASCYDLYMVRFNGSTEAWATKLTQTSATLPAYGVSATSGGNVIFIWSEYAHNGRIAFDGTNFAGYFGAAITVPNQGCVGSSTLTTGVNIHQGDRMQAVNGSTGALLTTPSFSFGCSHSGYERIVWDPIAKVFVNVCKNDAPTGGKSGKIAFAPNAAVIDPIDLNYDQIGNVINAMGGGYWIFASDIRPGQPANANGMADIHLLHVAKVSTPMFDKDIVAVSDGQNDRAPHLAPYGTAGAQMLAAWESSTALGDFSQNAARQMSIQILDSGTGIMPAGATATTAGPLKLTPNVLGSRYQDFRSFPDGSVAYPAPGSSTTKIKILRVLGCN